MLEGVPVLEIASAPLTGWSGLIKNIEDKVVAGGSGRAALAAAAADRARHPAGQPRAGAVPAKALRFQQPGNRRLQVPHDVPRSSARGGRAAGAQERSAGNAASDASCGRTSLDELPQLFNVLQGNMSMVGPRPHAVVHNEQYAQLIGGYHGRHKVKPGITGWAQINGFRGETDTLEKMRAARRARHLLHRELVAVVRPQDHAADQPGRLDPQERLLTMDGLKIV